jgi:hypothetical protein
LFEKERDTAPFALIPKRQNPFFLHRPGADSTLAAYNHPVDPSQVQFAHVLQQGLDGEKTNLGVKDLRSGSSLARILMPFGIAPESSQFRTFGPDVLVQI